MFSAEKSRAEEMQCRADAELAEERRRNGAALAELNELKAMLMAQTMAKIKAGL